MSETGGELRISVYCHANCYQYGVQEPFEMDRTSTERSDAQKEYEPTTLLLRETCGTHARLIELDVLQAD